MKTLTCALLTSLVAMLLVACGSDSSTTTSTPPPAAKVVGVATPTAVSVVTAN